MVVYHVCSYKKLQKYIKTGYIQPPVRAWVSIAEAERFSKQTGRRIILRLKFDNNYKKLDGHRSTAVYMDKPYKIESI